jgi:hypothetical protein
MESQRLLLHRRLRLHRRLLELPLGGALPLALVSAMAKRVVVLIRRQYRHHRLRQYHQYCQNRQYRQYRQY